jgi:curved DNA-binding protein CbpA
MKFDSPLFDRIRVKPEGDRRPRKQTRVCAHKGCREEGAHRAPMGRGQEGKFLWFCIDHVREYNASYNYFSGMTDDAVASYQKDAITGHRPTWGLGVNAARGRVRDSVNIPKDDVFDPFNLFGEERARQKAEETAREAKRVHNALAKALDALGLEVSATAVEVKAKFKDLAKRYHPDSNGGDRSSEERLREVINAYKYLKEAGYV